MKINYSNLVIFAVLILTTLLVNNAMGQLRFGGWPEMIDIPTGEVREFQCEITNVGDEPVEVRIIPQIIRDPDEEESVPPEIAVEPNRVEIPSGENGVFTFTIDTREADVGSFELEVLVITDDPGLPEVIIAIMIEVWGLPRIIIEQERIEYVGMNDPVEEHVLNIVNAGNEILNFLITHVIIEEPNRNEREWIIYEPARGQIEPDDDFNVIVTLNPEGLIGGLYEAELIIESNDPANPEVIVPVTMEVIGVPIINVVWDEDMGYPELIYLNRGLQDIFHGGPYEIPVTISNVGTDVLVIFDISSDSEYIIAELDGEFEIEVGEEMQVAFTFVVPDGEHDEHEAVITITSNDPENPEILVRVIIEAVGEQTIQVPFEEGWNLTSINVSPSREFYNEDEDRGPDIIRMMEQLRIDEDNHHVLLLKNEDGLFFAPAHGFNNIPYWDLTEGYQVKVDEDIEAVWTGEPIPPDTDIPLERNWNLIAYLPSYELDASTPEYYALSPIIDNVLIAKDGNGNFLLPGFDFSNMPPWRETQGYQVKVDADVVLNYPEEQEERAFTPPYPPLLRRGGKLVLADTPVCQIRHWENPTSSGENMSVLITSIQGIDRTAHQEVAAFNSDGQIVGTGTINSEGQCGIAVWCDDVTTEHIEGLQQGEAFTLKMWDANRNRELELAQVRTLEGEGVVYKTDGLSVLEMAIEATVPDDFFLSDAYPNPFNSIVRLDYGLPEATFVSIDVYDVAGRLLENLVNLNQQAGHYSTTWNSTGGDACATASGIYFVRMSADGFGSVKKIVLMK